MSNNYKPTKWLGGKTIGTAQVMNNIEQGISKAHDRLDSVDSDIVDINDVLNAIQKPEQSLGENGYVKLPGGLILQWGSVNVPAGDYNGYTGTFATLPIPFPNQILNISGTLSHRVEDEKYIIKELSISADVVTNQHLAFRYSHTGNFHEGGIQINYIAIGY